MINLLRAGALALVLLLCAPAMAQQHASRSQAPGGWSQETSTFVFAPVSAGVTEIAGSATSTAVTPILGYATFASGVAYVGPLTPQLGRPIRVVLRGTWTGTVAIGTSTDVNACAAGTINPLTVGGVSYVSYTVNANELVDEAWLTGIVYCATITVTSGTVTYSVRQ